MGHLETRNGSEGVVVGGSVPTVVGMVIVHWIVEVVLGVGGAKPPVIPYIRVVK